MPYTPSTLTLASWNSPITILGSDNVALLDEAVNQIVSTDTGSVKNFLNTELAKIPTYLSDELSLIHSDTISVTSNHADAAKAAQAAAEAALDSFDDRYLGAKDSAPTVDNDGNALVEGAHYWNTVSKGMFTWNGSSWQVWNSGVTLDTAQTISGAKDFTVVPKANGTDLATLNTAQTISGAKNFTTPPTINGFGSWNFPYAFSSAVNIGIYGYINSSSFDDLHLIGVGNPTTTSVPYKTVKHVVSTDLSEPTAIEAKLSAIGRWY